MSSKRGTWRSALLLVTAPCVYLTASSVPSDVLPIGLREAYGCSGASSGPEGWSSIRIASATAGPTSPTAVGTDGFLPLIAEGNVTEEQQKNVRVEVKTEQGEAVDGKLELLRELSWGLLYGWKSAAPLARSTKLIATLSASPAVDADMISSEFPLVVAGDPEPPPDLSLRFDAWWTHYRAEGPLVSCEAVRDAGGCGGPSSLRVGTSFVEQQSTSTSWSAPEASVIGAWELELEASADDPAEVSSARDLVFGAARDQPTQLGSAVFATTAGRHCVSVLVRDLRSGSATHTEHCESVGKNSGATGADAYTLGRCKAPPSERTLALWCQLQSPDDEDAQKRCTKVPTAKPAKSESETTAGATPKAARSAGGCHLGAPAQNAASWLTPLGLLAAALLFRRRTEQR